MCTATAMQAWIAAAESSAGERSIGWITRNVPPAAKVTVISSPKRVGSR